MARVGQDFALKQGDDRTIAIRVTDAAGEPVSLSGAQIEWRLARHLTRSAFGPIVLRKTHSAGVTLGQETVGGKTYALVQIDLSAAETASLGAPEAYYYDCRITLGGRRSTVAHGAIGVQPSPAPVT